MYKAAQTFQDYMDRSNRFVDRILAGGNKAINYDAVLNETDTEILLESLARFRARLTELQRVMLQYKAQKSQMNRTLKGKPDDLISPAAAEARRRINDQHRRSLDELQTVEMVLDLLYGRLSSLGIDTTGGRHHNVEKRTSERVQQPSTKKLPKEPRIPKSDGQRAARQEYLPRDGVNERRFNVPLPKKPSPDGERLTPLGALAKQTLKDSKRRPDLAITQFVAEITANPVLMAELLNGIGPDEIKSIAMRYLERTASLNLSSQSEPDRA